MQQGDQVWFDSGLGFLSPGVVMQVKRNPFLISILNEDTNERVQLPGRTILASREKLPEPYGADDMVHLKDLHSGSILQNIMFRFEIGQIYTYIGSILLSVNPYRLIKDLYGNRAIERYRDKILGNQAPHLYAVANEAYINVCSKGEDQVIIVSGESGAGKTESTKLILQYLTSVSLQGKLSKGKLISDRLLESSPLLESFGNAKTLRNDNSSRFGKFMEIKITDKAIVGAQLKEYLLEKSRIVYQTMNERNYHVFYEMLSGMSENQKSKYGLSTPHYFHYLNQGGKDLSCTSKNDFEDFQRLVSAMDVLGISQAEQDGIFTILAAILHLGNITFYANEEEGEAKIREDSYVHAVSSLLKVKPSDLIDDITYRVTETKDERIYSCLSIYEAIEARDGIAKALYAQLFKWLVQKVNNMVGNTLNSPSVNLLDIFGFEVFPKNSFEQLCINYANESLQQVFIRSVFKTEQTEYQRERIDWHSLDYSDNLTTIELMSKKPTGIMHILDDQSNFPQANDHSFLEKVSQVHRGNEAFKVDKLKDLQFSVRHYAGDVSYSAYGLLEKNRDRLRFETLCLLAESGHPLVGELFAELHSLELDRTFGPHGGSCVRKLVTKGLKDVSSVKSHAGGVLNKRKAPTVAAKFHSSLVNLITVIGRCNPFFVRCIKPNNTKTYAEFDRQLVVAQLNYLGVLETIKIRKLGYPIRLYFAAFINRYRCLMLHLFNSTSFAARTLQTREICEVFLKSLQPRFSSNFQLGLTKVFMREDLERHLEMRRNDVMWVAASRIQSWARAIVLRKKFLLKRQSAIVIQKYFRQYSAKQKYLRYKWAVTRLQAYRRGKQTRQYYLTLRTRHRMKMQQEAIKALDASIQQSNDVYLARLGATQQTMVYVVPEELAEILSQDLTWANVEDDAVGKVEHSRVALKLLGLELPDRIDSFSLSKYTTISLRGDLIWGESRESLQIPYHFNIHESYFPLVECLNKTLLYCLYEENLNWEHMKVVCAYIIKLVQSEPMLKDEAYIQLCSQTWRLKNNMHQKRAWIIMCAFLDTFPPSAQFANYLLKYVSDWAFSAYKVLCQHKLLKCALITNYVVTRNTPVTWLEWLANDRQLGTAIELFLLDSSSHVAQIDSWDTCEEVVMHLMHYLNLPAENSSGWTLSMQTQHEADFSIENGETDVSFEELPGNAFVFDSIAKTEYLDVFLKSSPGYQQPTRRHAYHVNGEAAQDQNVSPNTSFTNDYPEPDYNSAFINGNSHNILIRGVRESAQLQIDSSPKLSQEELVQRLLKAIQGEGSPSSNELSEQANRPNSSPASTPVDEDVASEENGDNVSRRMKKQAPRPPPGQSGDVSQSIKVISNVYKTGAYNEWAESEGEKRRKESVAVVTKEMKHSIRMLKENKAGHVLQVADAFKSQGIFLAGRGLGEHLNHKKMNSSQNGSSSSRKERGGDGMNTEGDGGSSSGESGTPVGERAVAVQRMMHDKVKNGGSVHDSRQNVLDEMKRKNMGSAITSTQDVSMDETDDLFADTETGFSVQTPRKPQPSYGQNFVPVAPPPPSLGPNRSEKGDEDDDTRIQTTSESTSVLVTTRVAPPVAFSGGTKTITENRKNLFTKDLAALEDEKTHQEAIRLLKRNSVLKEERDKKPIRRESSKRPALSMNHDDIRATLEQHMARRSLLVSANGDRALSPVFDQEASGTASVIIAPSEAVRQEQDHDLMGMHSKNNEVGSRKTSYQGATSIPVFKPTQPHFNAPRGSISNITQKGGESNVNNRYSNHRASVSGTIPPVTQGKVSSAVKRLDSVLNEKTSHVQPVVMKPEVYHFKATRAENYKENIALTVRKFVIDDTGNTQLYSTKKTPFLRYDKVPWKFFVRKEMFSPTEKVNHHRLKTLLFHQIVADVFSSGSPKLTESEQSEMITYLTANGVRNFTETSYVSDDVRDWVIACAKSWKLYFSRIYPVVVIRDRIRTNSGYLNFTHIAVSHSGLKLVSNESADGSHSEFKVVTELYYPNVKLVEYDHKLKKLEIRADVNQHRLEPIVVFTEQGFFLKRLIERYQHELEYSTVALVKAVDSHQTGALGELQYRRGDVIRVLDEYPLQPIFLGELNGAVGRVLKTKITTYVVHEEVQSPHSVTEIEYEVQESVVVAHRQQKQLYQQPSSSSIAMSQTSMDDRGSLFSQESVSAIVYNENITAVPVQKGSMLEYAMNYFRPPKEKSIRDDSAPTEVGIAHLQRRLRFQKTPMTKSLTEMPTHSDNLYAERSFKNLLRFTGDTKKEHKADYNIVYDLLKISKKSLELSDEVYCQLIKQTTENRSLKKDGYFKYWRLFALLASFSQCSNNLKRYMWRYLNDTRSSHPPKLANLVIQNMGKTFKYGGRTELPGVNEMKAFCDNRTCKRQSFVLPGRLIKTVKVFTATLVWEAVSNLAAQIGIHDPDVAQQFGIALSIAPKSTKSSQPGASGNYLSPLPDNSYLMDAITKLEMSNKEYTFVFVRLFWTVPLSKFPTTATHIIFSQIMTSFQEGMLVSVNVQRPLTAEKMELISKLVAIDMRLTDPEQKPAEISTSVLLEFLPSFMHAVFKKGQYHEKQWLNQVEKHFTNTLKLSPEQSKRLFIELVSTRPLFGAAVYPTLLPSSNPEGGKTTGSGDSSMNALIAINKSGISVLNFYTGNLLDRIEIENISAIKAVKTAEAPYVIVSYGGNYMRPSTKRIPCLYAEEVLNFVLGYQHRLGLTLKTYSS
ncbi:unconventional myosin-XV-like isoform X2 [Convolutriloba macropyga]|uniref:unconventional myosin-XV-like isoform X2 n=1 Tax=Convolutriloba macropyga TaxID=536237 RepID=UPI003F528422